MWKKGLSSRWIPSAVLVGLALVVSGGVIADAPAPTAQLAPAPESGICEITPAEALEPTPDLFLAACNPDPCTPDACDPSQCPCDPVDNCAEDACYPDLCEEPPGNGGGTGPTLDPSG